MSSHGWIWPRGTYFQRRLEKVRTEQTDEQPIEAFGDRLQCGERNGESADLRAIANHPDKAESASWTEFHPTNTVNTQVSHEPPDEAAVKPITSELYDSATSAAQAKPSTSQERNDWVRAAVDANTPVDIVAGGLGRAPRKQNLDRFRSTLVDSGEWVRGASVDSASDAAPSIDATSSSIDVQVIVPAETKPTELPVAKKTETASAVAPKQAPDRMEAKNGAHAEPQTAPTRRQEGCRQGLDQKFAQSDAKVAWDEIDERFAWLADPQR